MGNIFSGSEIAEIGIQIEKNGRDFYNGLVKKIAEKKIQDILKYLAAQEELHIALFQQILGSVEKYEPAESYPGEYFAYMSALAKDCVFTQKDTGTQAAESIKNTRDAIDKAIGFEKDSIVFYEGAKKIAPPEGQKIVDELILQEQGHLRQLLEIKAGL
ncbi:MAG: ferritin family protein [Candidatus Omnitrophota bacterium]|nr:ferritin family protein [Candidatus Omnitrophota bacterium]